MKKFVFTILAYLTITPITLAHNEPDPKALFKSPNPYTVLGLDPLTVNEIDLEYVYDFWTRIYLNRGPDDRPTWLEIETAYRNLKDPRFVEAFFHLRKQITKQKDSYLFSISPQDFVRFIKLRIEEMRKGFYNREEFMMIAVMIRQLHEGSKRDLIGAPASVARGGIKEFFESRMFDFNRVFLEEIKKISINGSDYLSLVQKARLPHLTPVQIKQFIADSWTQNEPKDFEGFLNLRKVALALNHGQPDSIVDEGLGDVLLAFKQQDSFKFFLASLSPAQLKAIHYFVPQISQSFCLDALRSILLKIN
jgi:hypothetical protein